MVAIGTEIIYLDYEYFEIFRLEEPVCIPYYRIIEIIYQGKLFLN